MDVPNVFFSPERPGLRRTRVRNGTNNRKCEADIEMIIEPKRKPHEDDRARTEREHQEEELDEALKNTFPASDPVSIEQPLKQTIP